MYQKYSIQPASPCQRPSYLCYIATFCVHPQRTGFLLPVSKIDPQRCQAGPVPSSIDLPTCLLAWITNSTMSKSFVLQSTQSSCGGLRWAQASALGEPCAPLVRGRSRRVEEEASGSSWIGLWAIDIWAVNMGCAVHLLNVHPQTWLN